MSLIIQIERCVLYSFLPGAMHCEFQNRQQGYPRTGSKGPKKVEITNIVPKHVL